MCQNSIFKNKSDGSRKKKGGSLVVRRLKISSADLDCRSGCEKRLKNKTVVVMVSLLAMILLSLYLPDTHTGLVSVLHIMFPHFGPFLLLSAPAWNSLPTPLHLTNTSILTYQLKHHFLLETWCPELGQVSLLSSATALSTCSVTPCCIYLLSS